MEGACGSWDVEVRGFLFGFHLFQITVIIAERRKKEANLSQHFAFILGKAKPVGRPQSDDVLLRTRGTSGGTSV